jgi:hypothetical protein
MASALAVAVADAVALTCGRRTAGVSDGPNGAGRREQRRCWCWACMAACLCTTVAGRPASWAPVSCANDAIAHHGPNPIELSCSPACRPLPQAQHQHEHTKHVGGAQELLQGQPLRGASG